MLSTKGTGLLSGFKMMTWKCHVRWSGSSTNQCLTFITCYYMLLWIWTYYLQISPLKTIANWHQVLKQDSCWKKLNGLLPSPHPSFTLLFWMPFSQLGDTWNHSDVYPSYLHAPAKTGLLCSTCCCSLFSSTRGDYGHEKFRFARTLVFIQCIINCVFAKICEYVLHKMHTKTNNSG